MADASKSKRRQMLPRTGGMASSATKIEGTTEEAGKLQSRPIEELDTKRFSRLPLDARDRLVGVNGDCPPCLSRDVVVGAAGGP